ncbi:MAG: GAF domain-containing SpoIIE family protein phosphatase [Planctomycetota bacterium]|nr:GAF domain-containing SpoIIE family protein phosphatase [Planctomycetota bacterium]
MVMADAYSAYPESDYQNRVVLLCDEFSRATGWTVRFLAESRANSGTHAPATDPHSENAAGGTIELLLPSGLDDETRKRAQKATSFLAKLIGELGATWTDRTDRDNVVHRLMEMGQAAATSLDGREVINTLLNGAVELTQSQLAGFHLLDPDTETLELRGESRAVGGRDTATEVVRRLRTSPVDLKALVDGPQTLSGPAVRSHQGDDWIPEGTATAVCVPVIGADGPLGTLWVTSRRIGDVEIPTVELIQAVATQLAGVLERLATRDEQAIRERLLSELAGLSECNSGEQLGILPPGAGFQAVGRCRSRDEVGGDLCELVSLADGKTLVAVGDACGHSVQAAFIMTAVRSALSTVLDDGDAANLPPAEVVARMNRALCRVTAGHHFMSCLVGIVDSRRMTFTYSNAGHPVPILYRDRSCQSLESHGMPLGIIPDAEYTSAEIHLRGQDVMVLFSDGVLETMDADSELFGSQGVVSAVETSNPGESLEEMLGRIWDASEDHGAGPTEDDKTLLVLRMDQRPIVRAPHHRKAKQSLRSSTAAAAADVNSRCS